MMNAADGDKRKTNLIAICCAVGGTAGFVCHDVLIKALSGGYALHEITFIRGLVAALVTLLVLMPLDGGYAGLRINNWKIQLLRAVLAIVSNITFYMALASLPIGDATAIFFIAPLVITAAAAILLGEPIGPRRWSAVILGLIGVLLVVRPGAEAFRLASLLPLAAAVFYGLMQVLTRKLGLRAKASTSSLLLQLTFVAVSGGIGIGFGDGRYSGSVDPSVAFLTRTWIWPPAGDWPVLAMIGLLSALAAYLLANAYRLAEAGLVAPFEYVAMPMAIAFGIVLWGDWPALTSWFGILLIGGSGLYVFMRETWLGKTSRKMPIASG